MATLKGSEVLDQPYLHYLQEVQFRPVFIMGHHRSGTTVLYQLLSMSKCFAYVNVYHLMRYGELLANHFSGTTDEAKARLQADLRNLGIPDSRFDGVAISPDFPEEYGFHFGNRYNMRLRAEDMQAFVELCKKVQLISGSDAPLLLKNPWDYEQFLYLMSTFPESKFIFIHRYPIAIVNSQINAIRSIFQDKNMYHTQISKWYADLMERPLRRYVARKLSEPNLGLGVRIVSRHVRRAAQYFLDHVNCLSQDSYMNIRYEDLCADPNATIRHILAFLNIPAPPMDYEAFIRPSQQHLQGEVKRQEQTLNRRLQPYLSYCGYLP